MASESILMYVSGRLPELWLRTGEHILLTGCSTLFALFIGLPLGIFTFRNSLLRNPVMGTIGIFQTIPSLAMLAFLLVLLQKIGALPAVIALTLYALLPIVRNTLTGLEGVPHQVMEAAKGIGMTEYQQFTLVRIPLAAPVILAGIRTAAVVGVGIATLSAFIGAGGLGQFINRGLALSDTRLILLGAVPTAILALIVDFSIGSFGWALRPQRKRDTKGSLKSLSRPFALMMPFLLLLVGLLSYFARSYPAAQQTASTVERPGTVRITTKNFTEQVILGEIMAQLIEAKTDLIVDRRFNLGGTMICHGALVSGEVDLYAEYTGTALRAILDAPAISDPDKAFQFVADAYREQFGLIWLRPFGFDNTYAITVRAADAKRRGWNQISDLIEDSPKLRAGFTAEFAERPDGYPGIRRAYGLEFGELRDLDPSLMYEAASKGEVDVICGFATDGRIASYNLVPLKDDLRFFPPYYAAPVIRKQVLRNHPEIEDVLSYLGGRLDDTAMQRLNLEVDGEGRDPAEVAKTYLNIQGLL
jgi:osmoprotectant transport system permease protein